VRGQLTEQPLFAQFFLRATRARYDRSSPTQGAIKDDVMGQELTTANKILVAASHLAEENDTFTAEDLIVRAWTDFPESFGLTGYRDRYPDSNRVLSKLMGSVGLCSRGWLEQVSTKLYRITPGGRKFAAALGEAAPSNDDAPSRRAKAPRALAAREAVSTKSEPPPARTKPRLVEPEAPARPSAKPAAVAAKATSAAAAPPPKPARAEAEPPAKLLAPAVSPGNFEGLGTLRRLVTSAAHQKFSRGAMVTFADACAFWAITPSIHAAQLAPRLIEVEALLKRAEQAIQAAGAGLKLDDRTEVTLMAVIGLQGMHKMLKQKYQRELDQIRARGED
jgi:hypothetical protein